MKNLVRLIGLVLVIFGLCGGARAQSESAPQPPRGFSLTFSPIHLTLPMAELTGEWALGERLAVAAIAGVGKITLETTDSSVKRKATVAEGGAQLRYYLLGNARHRMPIGAQVLYIHLSHQSDAVSAQADGLAIGPFVGYKFTAAGGFTFDTQLGIQRVGIAAQAHDKTNSASNGVSETIALLNLKIGWSW